MVIIIVLISTTMQVNIDLNTLDAAQVLELIQASLSGDNERIKQATRLLKAYTKHKASIRVLIYILVNSPLLPHRQMATVLLKRNLVPLYEGLSVEEKAEFRSLLLQQYAKESHLLVQRGIATLISILLPVVEIKNWVELQQLLDSAIQSAPESAATFVLLNSILYHFKPPAALYNYLLNALLNPHLAEEAIKCVVAVAETQDIDPGFAVQFIKIWEQAGWGEEISCVACEVLTVMVERRLKLADDVTIWVCDRIIANRKLSNKLRTAGCDYLFSFADFAAKQLASREVLLKKVVETVCLTCAEPYHHKEDEEETGEFVQEIALWLIETLAITVKPKKIYPVLFQAAVSLIKSEDSNMINTGFLVLGAICEGCAEKVKKNLQNPIMNVLIPRGLSHAAPEVRGAAINALCYFSEHLVPDIFDHHAVIIPAMLGHTGDLSTKVGGKALIAIDVFFDGMEQEDIIQYLPAAVPRLIEVLGAPNSTPLMKAASISAIGSAVYVAEQKFQPFLQSVLPVCLYLLTLPASPELNTVRAENLNVLGKLANVFCKTEYVNNQAFYETYIMGTMQTVYQLLTVEQDPEIREAAFAFFYLIANAIGTRFEVVFDNLIPIVIAACQPKEDPAAKKKDFSLDSDSEDEEQVNIATQKVTEQDEKAAAIHALGEFAKACPLKFTPYFQEAYRLLQEHYQHFYENIRVQVCHSYTNLTLGLVKSRNNGVIPPVKKGLPCVVRYPQPLEEHFRTVIVPRLLTVMTEDDDNKVRGAAVESIDDLIKELGPSFIDRNLTPLSEGIMKLLEAEVDQDDEEQEGEEDEDETDVHTFESLCDLIPTLADNLRTGFEPTLSELHPYLLKYLEEREEINDNVQMTGCLSQCFKWAPGYAANHAEELFQSLTALVPLWETEINRNVAYCLAEMFEKSPSYFGKHLPQGLLLLKQIFDHPSSSEPCRDNALAAICRVIYTINPPMPQQVFVDTLIPLLPFKGDEEEEPSALKAILFLASNNPQVLSPHRQALIALLENDLSQVKKYNLEEPLIGQLTALLGQIKV